jgi:acetolactate synthase I/II/III large subunit
MTETVKGGRLLAEQLAAAGVETIFSLAGAGHTHLLIALEDLGVRIIGTRHETGAVGAADGYARASGKVGVAAIIAEQGLPNAITPIQTAFLYGSPVVVLVTRFPQSWLESAGEIPVDHHALLAPITKWTRTVPAADKLGEYLEAALRISQSGRPGPVVLVMPQDYLAAQVPETPRRAAPEPPLPAAASEEAIAELRMLLTTAERPAILVDAGLMDPSAGQALESLNALGVPVFGYGGARGALTEADDTGVLPWPFAQFALSSCDLLIVAGSRLNMWFGFGRAPRFPEGLRVAQIDTVAEAIGRNRAVTLGIVADPGIALGQLADVMAASGRQAWSRDWIDAALAPRREAIVAEKSEAIHALTLVQLLQMRRPQHGVFVGDGADILNWSHAAIRIARPRGYMDHHPMGSMGIGLPLALGAAAAEQDLARAEDRDVVPVTLLTGDGALGFYIAELDTVAREQLPLKVVIGNDAQWGTEYHGQKLITGRFVNTQLVETDYAVVAAGFGLGSASVTDEGDLPGALDTLFASSGPALLDVRIDPDAGARLKTDPRLSFLIFSDLAPPAR